MRKRYSQSLWWLCLITATMFASCKKEVKFEANDETSLRYFEGGPTDRVENVSITKDGGFIYFGSTLGIKPDGFIMKVNANGLVDWYKTIGGKYQEKIAHAIQTSDGGFIAVGQSNSIGFGANDSITKLFDFVAKLDAQGNLQWQKSILNLESENSFVCEDDEGNFHVVGSVELQYSRILALKYNKDGNLLRGVAYTALDRIPPNLVTSYYRAFGTFAVQENNQLLVAGMMSKSGNSLEARNYVSYWMKISLDSLESQELYPFYQFDRGQIYRGQVNRYNVTRVIKQSDGYILATDIEDPVTRNMSIQLIKSDFGGNMIWEKKYPGLNNSVFRNIHEQEDGTLFIVGASTKEEMNYNYPLAFRYLKMMISKLTADGNEIWSQYYGSEENVHVAMAAVPGQDGTIKVAGATNLNETSYDRMNILYLDKDGKLLKTLNQ